MRTIIMIGLAAISLSACATTKREEVRNDIKSLEQSRDDLQSAERDGSIKDVQEAREDVRHADRDLRTHQSELYRPGAEGSAIVSMKVGQSDPGNLRLLPDEYRLQYPDDGLSYYRYDGGQIYRFRAADRIITDVYPVSRR
ncbi:MAG: hypothetical protein V4579_05385 [Pseudomonadota bacterium]